MAEVDVATCVQPCSTDRQHNFQKLHGSFITSSLQRRPLVAADAPCKRAKHQIEGSSGVCEEQPPVQVADSLTSGPPDSPWPRTILSPLYVFLQYSTAQQTLQGVPVRTLQALRDNRVDDRDDDTVQVSDQGLTRTAPCYGQPSDALCSPNCHRSGSPMDRSASDQDCEEVEELEFDPLLFMKRLPPLEQCVPKFRPVLLPRQTRQCFNKKTLVLDLDETLVHSSLEGVPNADFDFPVNFNNRDHIVHVRQRPHMKEFLERVADLFEVVIFTASQKIYAEKLLNILDPEKRFIRHRIYRDSCVVVDGNYLKDLSILGRDLSQTFIIDNSPQAFAFQIDNGVPIESWYDDADDRELLKLLPFLESLVAVADVRPLIRDHYKLRELIQRLPG